MESEIVETNEVLVSICCITYNQEKYIGEAIESFLMQKTNFKYEIIIYDDASTDRTQDIIKEYEMKYPQIIKPIYSQENQYSKGKQTFMYTFEKAIGKYIAMCEGDDYWINEDKLQKQVDYMESNSECTFCFHNAKELYMNSKKMITYIDDTYTKFLTKDGIYTPDQILNIGYVGRIPTASFMFKTEHAKNFPDWFYTSICGDMPIKLIMSSYGYGYYIAEEMSVYRRETGISVTDKWNDDNRNIEKVVNNLNRFIEIIENFDKFTNYKYTQGLEKSKNYYKMQILYVKKEYKQIFSTDLSEYYKIAYKDPFYIKHYIKKYLKIVYKIYQKLFK